MGVIEIIFGSQTSQLRNIEKIMAIAPASVAYNGS